MSLQISSEAFGDGQRIARKYTGDGENVSPPLHFDSVPKDAKELALIVDDPDAPRAEPFVHWVIYQIPAGQSDLPEAISPDAKLQSPAGAPQALQGKNSFGKIGYGGPAPPPGHGTHHYQFHLYALDEPLKAQGGLDKKALLAAMSGHVIEEAQIVATYERP